MALLPGTRLGRYEILSALGAGGMGEVYAARDTELDRNIAIKILPGASTQHADRVHRFVKEAKAASALNHPNILTVYEIGRAGDQYFIAAELVDGQTLRQWMSNRPPSTIAALDVAIQVTGALAAAHAGGVVHRDIKPENVMVRPDGYVKLLDFGLAKLIDQRPDTRDSSMPTVEDMRTRAGVVMGTARYMSPEQARGLEVDARTDIFSFGVVLYEMLAGRAAFNGVTPSDLLVAILQSEPPPLGSVQPETPPDLERIVAKALRKDREERYQTIRDLQVDLRSVRQELDRATQMRRSQSSASASSGAAPVKARRRRVFVAVAGVALATLGAFLYMRRPAPIGEKDTILLADFVNTTGEPEFDGSTLKQALMGSLRQTPFLNLFPEEATRETLRMMGRPIDERVTRDVAREISQRQAVKALIVGSIASIGRHFVVTLEAFDARTGETIASHQVEAESKEQVLTALGQAATVLRKSLGESLSTIEKYNAPMEQVTTSSLEALKVFSTGTDQFMRGDARGALPLINRAIEIDPDFAEAHDALAWIRVNLGDLRGAAESSERAFALRDRVTELEKFYILQTYHHWATGDWAAEHEVIQLARRLYPNDWTWPHTLAISGTALGQDEEALTEEADAIRLNPNVVHPYRFLAIVYAHLNRFDEAKQVIRETQARKMDGPFFHTTAYGIAVAEGDQAEMRKQLDWMRAGGGETQSLAAEARAGAAFGRWREALSLYRRIADMTARPGVTAAAPLPLEATQIGSLLGVCDPADSSIIALLAPSRIAGAAQRLTLPIQSDGLLCGNAGDAEKLAAELEQRFPKATMVKGYSLPVIRSAIALQRNQADRAVEQLKAAAPYGRGWTFLPTYLRGQAYLRLRRGREAAAEFETIISHRGWDPVSVLFPLAYLGRARATALADDRPAARKQYEAFFELWKAADTDLPMVMAAKQDYARVTGVPTTAITR